MWYISPSLGYRRQARMFSSPVIWRHLHPPRMDYAPSSPPSSVDEEETFSHVKNEPLKLDHSIAEQS